MAALHELNLLTIVYELMDRGLTGEQIDRAMRHLIGRDWREVRVSEWHSRLRNSGHVLQNNRELTVNDLEALVQGRIKIDNLGHSD